MIRVVLDTNILASGTVNAFNSPGQILDAWRAHQFELITSEHILCELEHTFQKPYFQKHINTNKVNALMDLLRTEAFVTPIIINVQGVATHPEDNLIIAAAISAKADYLVTGDGLLLRKVGKSYKRVKLVTPKDFLKLLPNLTSREC